MLLYDKIRQYPRAPLKTLVKERSGKGSPFYYSKDICEGGIFLITKQPLSLGTKVELMFSLPEDTFTIRAIGETVSALTGPENYGMGVKFIEIGEAERRVIANYVKTVSTKGTIPYQKGEERTENFAAGSRSKKLELLTSAERAYKMFCSLDNSTKWQNVIDNIEVVERYQDGKLKSIKCATSLLIPRKKIGLDFLYNDKEKRVFWHSCGGDFTEIRGHVGFDDKGDNVCIMNFFIMVNTGMVIPQKIQEHIADEILPQTLDKFKKFVETQD